MRQRFFTLLLALATAWAWAGVENPGGVTDHGALTGNDDPDHDAIYTPITETDVSGNSYVLDEDDLVSDDATKLATQQSIKAYVDASSTSPGGSDPQVQYNNGGAFGGDSAFTFDDVTDTLTVTNLNVLNGGVGDVTTSEILLSLESNAYLQVLMHFDGDLVDEVGHSVTPTGTPDTSVGGKFSTGAELTDATDVFAVDADSDFSTVGVDWALDFWAITTNSEDLNLSLFVDANNFFSVALDSTGGGTKRITLSLKDGGVETYSASSVDTGTVQTDGSAHWVAIAYEAATGTYELWWDGTRINSQTGQAATFTGNPSINTSGANTPVIDELRFLVGSEDGWIGNASITVPVAAYDNPSASGGIRITDTPSLDLFLNETVEVLIEAASLTLDNGSLIFEGATADAFEMTISITDPTADRTITVPDADVVLADIALNTTHKTSDGSDHTFIDQDVTAGSAPVLDGAGFFNVADGALPATITRDTEWDTAAEINAATTDDDFVTLTGAQSITGLKNAIADATGALGSYDLAVGDITTPDYGSLQLGGAAIYRTSAGPGGMDFDGAMLFRQESALGVGNDPGIEFAFMEGGNTVRLAIPESGAGNALAAFRSLTIAGPYSQTNGNAQVTGDYWTAYDTNLDFDTGSTGADLFVQDDLEVEGEIYTHGTIRMDADDANQLTLSAANQTGSNTFTWPDDTPAANDVITADGAGTIAYTAVGASNLIGRDASGVLGAISISSDLTLTGGGGELGIADNYVRLVGDEMSGTLILLQAGTYAPIDLGILVAEPSSSLADGQIYLDDGTNTAHGLPALRARISSAFVDLGFDGDAGNINAGTLAHERGGLEADVSAYAGLIKISGGATSQAVSNTDYAAAAHAARHIDGGADAIDGDKVEMSLTLDNITPDTSIAEADSTDDLAAIVKGLDNIVASMREAGGRLTLESGVPVSTTAQDGQTIYYTPFRSDRIGLYDGSKWVLRTFSELSYNASGSDTELPYDLYAYDSGGTVTLESLAWTDTETRATALVRQDGIEVKSGATTRRYLGSYVMSDSVTSSWCYDSPLERGLWNADNRVPRPIYKRDAG
ncbi:MAG: hypothetical protein ACYTGH_09610, partial [Planctomycetota bacterium]